jgi:hypothetical protein
MANRVSAQKARYLRMVSQRLIPQESRPLASVTQVVRDVDVKYQLSRV